jgi:hypothetical protein
MLSRPEIRAARFAGRMGGMWGEWKTCCFFDEWRMGWVHKNESYGVYNHIAERKWEEGEDVGKLEIMLFDEGRMGRVKYKLRNLWAF